jgi:MFS transporter, DHA1 family, inner membrane transport protein
MPGPAAEDKPKSGLSGNDLGQPFVLVAVGRFLSNVSLRLVFPFIPRIATGLGVSLGTLGTALALRDLAGATSPVIGRGADRFGHGRSMTLALVALSVGLLMQGVAGGLFLFTLALVLITLAKNLFDVASGAWIGETVGFARRGRAIGLVETTWALSFLIAMPLAAVAIRVGTWRTPFLLTAVVVLAFSLQLRGRFIGETRRSTGSPAVRWTPTIRAGIAAMMLLGLGHQMLLVTFAAFLEAEHAVSVAGLGLTAAVIGAAELSGSGAAAVLSDSVGKSRSVKLALGLAIPASLLVPLGGRSLPTALLVLAIWFGVTEFAIVSILSLFTELDRAARGAVMGLAFGGWAMGNAMGALVGSRLFESQGMTLTAVAMALAFTACLATALWGLDDPADPGQLGVSSA